MRVHWHCCLRILHIIATLCSGAAATGTRPQATFLGLVLCRTCPKKRIKRTNGHVSKPRYVGLGDPQCTRGQMPSKLSESDKPATPTIVVSLGQIWRVKSACCRKALVFPRSNSALQSWNTVRWWIEHFMVKLTFFSICLLFLRPKWYSHSKIWY